MSGDSLAGCGSDWIDIVLLNTNSVRLAMFCLIWRGRGLSSRVAEVAKIVHKRRL
jgi:hypothetical protein